MLDNKNIQKVFSLSDFRKKQLLGEIPERTRETYREYGYVGGGEGSSSADRIDFSNDTSITSKRASQNVVRDIIGAVGNSNFGYFCGSRTSQSIVDRLDYSNDLQILSRRGDLSSGSGFSGGNGNSNFGYLIGPGSRYQRIDYSNDLSNSQIKSNSHNGSIAGGKCGNSNFGWCGGGAPGPVSTVSRLNYANDSVNSIIRGPLTLSRDNLSAIGNSNFGYFNEGNSSGTIIQRINYSNDLVTASNRSNFLLAFWRRAQSTAGNSNFGYYCGAATIGPAPVSYVERIDYSNDTVNAIQRGFLAQNKGFTSGTSSGSFGGAPNSSFASDFTFPTVPNAGYFGGGFDGTNVFATIDKVDYANDTATASVRSALSVARLGLAATGNSNFGYFGGGQVPSIPASYSTIDRLEYSSDTQNTVVRGPLSSARSYLGATGNSNFGYFYGSGPSTSTVDRIDYSTDTSAASTRGPLSLARGFGENCATGNANFGYFAGGFISSNVSTIDRVDYANDSMTALARNNLIAARRRLGAFGNNNFGYFAGGSGPFSSVERIDYANDTSTPSFRGNLSNAINQNCGTDNSNFAYSAGGGISTVDRINFSNDTAVASIRGSLSTAKVALTATSPLAYGGAPIYFTNPLPEVLQKQIEFNDSNTLDLPFKRVLGSFGYFGGGNSVSTVDRIDYSNDLATASIRSPLLSATYLGGAAGSTNYGYYLGGFSSILITFAQRIDYSNDLATPNNRFTVNISGSDTLYRVCSIGNQNQGFFGGSYISNLRRINYSNDTSFISSGTTELRWNGYATGNNNFGYFGGGNIPGFGVISSVDRISYSNSSTKSLIRGPLAIAKIKLAATGNNNFGYFGGGWIESPVIYYTTVERIDYSNDTATLSIRSNFPTNNKVNAAATGNNNFGYFGSGSVASNSVVYRVDYSNDTNTPSTRGPLSVGRGGLKATTNARNS